jgi:hypothetical protein
VRIWGLTRAVVFGSVACVVIGLSWNYRIKINRTEVVDNRGRISKKAI